MASMKEIIEINIVRETRGVSRQGFGTPLFLGNTSVGWASGEVVRTYTSLDSVLEDFSDTTPEYTAAQRIFGQQVSPTYIKIGRHRNGTVSADVVVTPVSSTLYSVTVDGVEASYTSDVDATAQEIVTGLEAAFAAAAAPGSFEDNGDGTFTIFSADSDNFTLITSVNLEETLNSESLTQALTNIANQDNDWYFVTAYTHDPEDMLEIAGYVQARTAIYFTSYNGPDALDSTATNDPGSRLQALDYSRTVIMYAEDESEYPECAIVGLQAPKDPGSTTWKFKTVSGVIPSNLSTTNSIVLKGTKYDFGKGYNTYEPTGGRTIFAEGRVVNSEYIDIIRGADWLEARMRERIFITLVNSEKIPYTSTGFAIIEGRMREVLNEGIEVGLLGSYKVTVPNPRNRDPNDRANRVATGFEFRGVLQGAVHAIEIAGTLEI